MSEFTEFFYSFLVGIFQNFLEIICIFVRRERLALLLLIAILSLLLLFFSFLLVFSKVVKKTLRKFLVLFVIYLGAAFPIISTVYAELRHPSFSLNLDLGNAFLFTWILTGVVFIFAIIFRYKKDEDEYLY
jgi:hypothetical protein